jgi:hypothetical protein
MDLTSIDFFAHSNYTELALIELGEQDVFPHVGRNTKLRIPGARQSVYPLVTGTFGGVDFLHSVTGEGMPNPAAICSLHDRGEYVI